MEDGRGLQFGGFRRDIFGYFLELGATAADNGARAGALGWTVILSEAAQVVHFVAAEIE